MDIDKFQEIERQLSEQAEATHTTNEALAKIFLMLSTKETKKWSPTTTGPSSHRTTCSHYPEHLATLMD
jgi:hypothetical protein